MQPFCDSPLEPLLNGIVAQGSSARPLPLVTRSPNAMTMRRFVLLLLIWLAVGPQPFGVRRAPVWNHARGIDAVRLLLDPARPSLRTVGLPGAVERVRVTEAWWIRSANSGFGGYSALSLIGPRRFLLAADTGMVTGFTLTPSGDIDRPFIAPFPSGPGSGPYKTDRDLESMTSDPGRGLTWTAFEHSNQIWRFGRALARAEAHVAPPAMATWNDNGGAEAMVRLRDGRFLVMSESTRVAPGGTAALLFAGDPTERTTPPPLRFAYDARGLGKVTDAAELPDGRILLLHRRLSLRRGFVSILAIADIATVQRGIAWQSRAIAEFATPLLHDNFEGLAVEDRPGGDNRPPAVWMISDDNLLRWQRTLLLRLELPRATTTPPVAQPGFTTLTGRRN
jgi:hypothetical protein